MLESAAKTWVKRQNRGVTCATKHETNKDQDVHLVLLVLTMKPPEIVSSEPQVV